MSFRKRKPQRPLWVEREKLTIRSLQAFNVEPPWAGEHAVDERAARTWKHVRAAEGVETEAEVSCLRNEGCHEGQGFLFSRARPNAEIVSLLKTQGNWSSPAGVALVA